MKSLRSNGFSAPILHLRRPVCFNLLSILLQWPSGCAASYWRMRGTHLSQQRLTWSVHSQPPPSGGSEPSQDEQSHPDPHPSIVWAFMWLFFLRLTVKRERGKVPSLGSIFIPHVGFTHTFSRHGVSAKWQTCSDTVGGTKMMVASFLPEACW